MNQLSRDLGFRASVMGLNDIQQMLRLSIQNNRD